MNWKVSCAIFILLHLQKSIDCQLERIHEYSRDLTISIPDDTRLVTTSAPLVKRYSDYVYLTNLICDDSDCRVEQHCLNCPNKSQKPRSCFFEAPSNDTSREANLLHLGYNGELVIIDWVTKAVVDETTERIIIQLVDLNSCRADNTSVTVPVADNNLRKIVLTDEDSFELFSIDFELCRSGGWVSRRGFDRNENVILEPECIDGTESYSQFKLAVDVVRTPRGDSVLLDEDRGYWTVYKLPSNQSHAEKLFKVSRAGSSPARLTAGNDAVALCWLSSGREVDCVGGDVDGEKNFTLRFPRGIRDFELQVNATSDLLYALTWSGEGTECDYDVWAFEMSSETMSEPVRIEGPPCAEARPVMTTGLDGGACVGFAFERKPRRIYGKRSVYPDYLNNERTFTALVDCFDYYRDF